MGIKKKSFTLIEIMVVIAVISFALPVLFSVIFTILRQQAKVSRLEEVKKQGDFVLSEIRNVIRNYGIRIYSDDLFTTEICLGPSQDLPTPYYIKDKFGNWFRYYSDLTRIASRSSILNNGLPDSTFLTTTKVRIEDLALECNRTGTYSPAVITISFKICYETGGACDSPGKSEDIAKMTYQTKIKLRSY